VECDYESEDEIEWFFDFSFGGPLLFDENKPLPGMQRVGPNWRPPIRHAEEQRHKPESKSGFGDKLYKYWTYFWNAVTIEGPVPDAVGELTNPVVPVVVGPVRELERLKYEYLNCALEHGLDSKKCRELEKKILKLQNASKSGDGWFDAIMETGTDKIRLLLIKGIQVEEEGKKNGFRGLYGPTGQMDLPTNRFK
jgi:hypothetical protein